MRLSELKTGESATILKVTGHGGFRRRIMEMGFVRGQRVEVVLNAPLRDPIEYRIMGYDISLRRSEADMVVVVADEEAERYRLVRGAEHGTPLGDRPAHGRSGRCAGECGCARRRDAPEPVHAAGPETICVALVGNPNSGKTSLFNAISGGHEHVGNYSGVTVGAKRGYTTYRGYRFEITDLPGTYALSAYTPEELYVRRHLAEQAPDVIVNAVVASNLERNLYLTTELIDLSQRMVVALNMYDELESSGAKLDYENLGRMLGVPMVPVVARSGRGVEELLDTVIAVYENRDSRVRHIHINEGPVIEESLRELNGDLSAHRVQLPHYFPPRYFSLKLLERDRQAEETLRGCERYPKWAEIRDREARRIEEALGEDVETALANQKYGFISGALKETYTPGRQEQVTATSVIDAFVTHKLWGFPIFFFLMWLMFYCTFRLGAYPQEWIETLVGRVGAGIETWMPAGSLKDKLVDGINGGEGGVIVFLPQIMILYLFISFMEDSGYLARAAFIMDKVMHRIGLHGKSFIPLIMGFGCNVPAIMATRTIESRSSRLITVLITPFMSCSARLPIYLLLAGTFFPSHAGLVLFGLYMLGILVAVMTARLMRRSLFKVDETPFVMELPPYRLPTWKATLSHMWDKCAQYLRKMGGLILAASVIVWFLSYYPRSEAGQSYEQHYESSYLGRVGKACEPVFEPLGLNWKASVALLSGVAAKEIVVSTMGVLYSEDANTPVEPDDSAVLHAERIGGASGTTEILVVGEASAARTVAEVADRGNRASADEAGPADNLPQRLLASGDFTVASAVGFLIFILIYFPCLATVAAIAAESGWKWAIGSVVYSTALAWIMAYLAYRITLFFI